MPFDKIDEKLAVQITAAFVETAVSDGLLDPRGKSEADFRREVIKYVRKSINNAPFEFAIDHRSNLLGQARSLRKKGRDEESVLYYATWIEHMLNSMAASILRRRRISQDLVRQFVRDTGIKAKYIFIVLHLCKRQPNVDQLNAIGQLSDHRNQFVHYKWVYYEEAKMDEQGESYKRVLTKAEAIVRHLKYVEHRYIKYKVKLRPTKAK